MLVAGLAALAAFAIAGGGVAAGINPIFAFRKTVTEYDRKPGVKWLGCTAK
jgi:hypothetical protein